ncbi:MAG: hypothetical protein P4L46_24205, partial [Fimbriimonas sp.]|nr:hypothetical protein [Fimbriimonas sp.]
SLLGRKARERDRSAVADPWVGWESVLALPRPQRSEQGVEGGARGLPQAADEVGSPISFGPVIGTDWLQCIQLRGFGQK